MGEDVTMAHLRLVKPPTENATVFAYENRMGVRFFLHEGRTKTGKPKYFFAKTVRDGSLTGMPEGFEVTESINGVVSVRKKKVGEVSVPPADVKLVEAALARHQHLRWYKARVAEGAIVVFEPHPRPEELISFAEHAVFTGRVENFVEERMKKAQYVPVMKFEIEGDDYAVLRMTYRGHGGWSYPLASGKLDALVKKFLPNVGTEKFSDIM
jgi:hypothetical protein